MTIIRTCGFLVALLLIVYLTSCSNDGIEEVNCNVSGLTLEVGSVIDAGCQPTGSITVSATGGSGELLFSLDGINFQSSPTFSGLSSGNYSIIVVDAQGCSEGVNTSIGNDGTDLGFTAETTVGGCGTGEGSITITASGGAGGYTYRLGTGTFGGSNIFDSVSGGIHSVTVKDADGCIHTKNVKVVSGISFTSAIKPIIDNNCNIITCHGNDPQIPSWSTYAEIQGSAQKIRSSVAGKTMPPVDKLTQNQIDLILCWIDDGAPNN
ncbi:MAG: hypothetical protein ACFHWX_07410 [Bacteroidota bacterium]